MHWELDDNVAAMRRALRVARHDGAAVCAFSELAVTGFHRRIAEGARPERTAPAIASLCEAAALLGIAIVFGAPTFGADGRPRIGHLFVDAEGTCVGTVEKAGLTPAEATFFAPGNARRGAVELAGRRCTAVVCREIEDGDALVPALAPAAPELVFWPGGMRPDPDRTPEDPPRYVVQAQDLARRLGAFVRRARRNAPLPLAGRRRPRRVRPAPLARGRPASHLRGGRQPPKTSQLDRFGAQREGAGAEVEGAPWHAERSELG
jgi:omega-amidase